LKKVTYIVSDIDKALAFEWVALYLNNEQCTLSFILLNKGNSDLEDFLIDQGIPVKCVHLSLGWKILFPFMRLWLHLLTSRPDIIHTHLRYASLLGITAGFFAGIKTRIHTRHNSSFHNIYHPHAVKTDQWVSRLSTKIVSISDVVTDVLVDWEGTPDHKIVKIPHGFDLDYFKNVSTQRVDVLRGKYNVDGSRPVVGMISRYIEWKGVIYGIEAFKKVRKDYPDALLVLANAKGPDAGKVKKALEELPNDAYLEIAFEEDIAALYRLFDVFVHLPIDDHFEAFGQTYIEALASGIPSVFTKSGIGMEMLIHDENALMVPYKDVSKTAEAVVRILSDENLRVKLSTNGLVSVQPYELKPFISRLENLYQSA
jgi:glycosyltransferase involved in cell wall biosynthesis